MLEVLGLMRTPAERPVGRTEKAPPAPVVHGALTGRDGKALAVEPLERARPDSKPPPGPSPPLWFGRDEGSER